MNIAIIDDLEQDRNVLDDYLKIYFSHNYRKATQQIFSFSTEGDFLTALGKQRFDIIFIDGYLVSMTGIELARRIRETDCAAVLIFTTVSTDFAVESYKVKASGYLLKPFSYEELSEIMSMVDYRKIKEHLYIELQSGSQMVRILLKDIVYCDVEGHYTRIHTKSMGIQRVRITLMELADILLPYPELIACYRGCIINLLQVQKMTEYNFLMINGEQVPFRQKEKAKFMKLYSEFLFEKVRNSDI